VLNVELFNPRIVSTLSDHFTERLLLD